MLFRSAVPRAPRSRLSDRLHPSRPPAAPRANRPCPPGAKKHRPTAAHRNPRTENATERRAGRASRVSGNTFRFLYQGNYYPYFRLPKPVPKIPRPISFITDRSGRGAGIRAAEATRNPENLCAETCEQVVRKFALNRFFGSQLVRPPSVLPARRFVPFHVPVLTPRGCCGDSPS